MTANQPQAIYLKDYKIPDFVIHSVFLHFDLHADFTRVKAILNIERNVNSQILDAPLILNGEGLELKAMFLDGKPLADSQYQIDSEHLTIPQVPNAFMLETEVEIKPQLNASLDGLYQSKGNFCTQCEPHGFRHITYFIDRPDVMTRFTTAITADKDRYPVLLSNGNLVDQKELGNNRHWVKWEDPSLKPCYLFALVAGDYDALTDTFVTCTGRTITLKLYVEKGAVDQCQHAMDSLKKAMKWDEEKFGREYDLDIYMIVAVSDFNMGAMENKGLNIFNTVYVLAKPETATDDDYVAVEGVIGHEYFHNWTGNRITCRDWFQLTLKEGLTVFRDEEFTADMNSRAVKRIQDARIIRTAQFTQDAGPLAHPIRPQSYIEMNNFYTVTVYNKGAEVIRMIQTVISPEKFRLGMDLYFERHDGQAVTADDFVQAMQDASGVDLTQFRRWYNQAGTPVLKISTEYNAAKQTYAMTIAQSCPPTPGQAHKEEFHIPLAMGLLDKKGQDLPLQLAGESHTDASIASTMRVLNIKKAVETFTFVNVLEEPVPSLLRNFSAPVKCQYEYTDEQLQFLLMHDSDNFNRWDAGQQLAVRLMLQMIEAYRQKKKLQIPQGFIEAYQQLLNNLLNYWQLDKLFLAEMLTLPSESYLVECMEVADVEAIHQVRGFLQQALADVLQKDWLAHYQKNQQTDDNDHSAEARGKRRLKNICLNYLACSTEKSSQQLAWQQFQQANNMTDSIAALRELSNMVESAEREQALQLFAERWKKDALVMDKWFVLQATSILPDTLERVKTLMQHPAYEAKNPNKIRALIGAFSKYNLINFHRANGEGYRFLADQVLAVDQFNPQIASRLVEPLINWKKFDVARQNLMKAEMQRILAQAKLSKDVYEIVSKGLQEQAALPPKV